MDSFFTSTSGRTCSQSSLSNSFSNCFIWLRGVPTRYWPPRLRIAARFSSLMMPRSKTRMRRAFVLTFHHAQDCFHDRDIRTVAVESFVTEREPLAVDDQRDYHLLAVGTMIARVAAGHHRIASAAPST